MVRFGETLKALYKWNFKEYVIDEDIEKVKEKIEKIPSKITAFSTNNIKLLSWKEYSFELEPVVIGRYQMPGTRKIIGNLTAISENQTKMNLEPVKNYWELALVAFVLCFLIVEIIKLILGKAYIAEWITLLTGALVVPYLLGLRKIFIYKLVEEDIEKYLYARK